MLKNNYNKFINTLLNDFDSDLFDDLDVYSKPQVLVDNKNFYQIEWYGFSTKVSFSMFLTEPEIILIVVFQKKANLNNFENEMEKLILNSVIKEVKLDWSFVADEDPIDMISAIKLDLRRLQEMEYE